MSYFAKDKERETVVKALETLGTADAVEIFNDPYAKA